MHTDVPMEASEGKEPGSRSRKCSNAPGSTRVVEGSLGPVPGQTPGPAAPRGTCMIRKVGDLPFRTVFRGSGNLRVQERLVQRSHFSDAETETWTHQIPKQEGVGLIF